MPIKFNKKGGDGYSVNVNEAIGTSPAISRYSNNYRPVFTGSLLEGGGGMDAEDSVFPSILQNGGKSQNDDLKQLPFIRDLAIKIKSHDIPIKNLVKFNTHLFLKNLSSINKKNSEKAVYLKSKIERIQKGLASLGDRNMILLSSILVLDNFERENKKEQKGGGDSVVEVGTGLLLATAFLLLMKKTFIKNNKNLLDSKIFHILSSLSFSVFGKKSMLKEMGSKKMSRKKMSHKKMSSNK